MSSITNATSLAALVGLLAGLTGCAGGRDAEPGSPVAAPSTQVRVVNHNWMDVTVYAVAGSYRLRLGTVVTSNSAVFDLPTSLVERSGRLRLLVDPIGTNRRHMTGPILVNAGDRIDLDVKNHLAVSSVMVTAMSPVR